jgi:hypothetical protein
MKTKLLILIIFFSSLAEVFSQGFDWQYSARLPFDVPTFFTGIDFNSSYNIISSDFNICDKGIPCDTFMNGKSVNISAGIKFEYWSSADLSYFTGANLTYSKNSFLNENMYYYFPEVGNKILEYEYLRAEYIPEIEIGVKYRMRFLLPHIFSSLSLKAGFVASSKEELILRKISEADWLADEIHFTGFESLKLSGIMFEPHLKLGYDVNLGLGSYSSIYVDIGLPIQNRYSKGEWYSTKISLGISIFPLGY